MITLLVVAYLVAVIGFVSKSNQAFYGGVAAIAVLLTMKYLP